MPPDQYKQMTGKKRSEIEVEQNRLVNLTIGLAFDELYAYVESKRMAIEKPSIVLNPHLDPLDPRLDDSQKIPLLNIDGNPCENAEETMQAINHVCQNEFERVLAYNQLAATYGFNLSIKTSGAKKIASIIGKDLRDHDKPDRGQDSDVIRVTAISPDLALLNSFEKKHSSAVNMLNNTIGYVSDYRNDKGWKMTVRGHLQRGIYKKVNGVGAELMLVPREQADIAARITHKYFEVTRNWETYQNDANKPQKKRMQVITEYNAMATMLNRLSSEEALPHSYLNNFNQTIRTSDTSSVTFDRVSEGGRKLAPQAQTIEAKDVMGHQPYSPVIETYTDLAQYSNFLLETRKHAKGALAKPMPILSEHASDEDIIKGMAQLDYMTQVTHVCFMRHASQDWRVLWTACAQRTNNVLKERGGKGEGIHTSMIECIMEGVDGLKVKPKDVQAKLHELEQGKANGR